MEYVLEMKDISKSFPGVKALDHVQLQVKPGEVHALMGENGAGKSTLMKILMGIYTKDEGGEIIFNGQPYHVSNPKEAMDHGVAMIHQELNPIWICPCMKISSSDASSAKTVWSMQRQRSQKRKSSSRSAVCTFPRRKSCATSPLHSAN